MLLDGTCRHVYKSPSQARICPVNPTFAKESTMESHNSPSAGVISVKTGGGKLESFLRKLTDSSDSCSSTGRSHDHRHALSTQSSLSSESSTGSESSFVARCRTAEPAELPSVPLSDPTGASSSFNSKLTEGPIQRAIDELMRLAAGNTELLAVAQQLAQVWIPLIPPSF